MRGNIALAMAAAGLLAAPLLSGQNSLSAPANPYEGEIQVWSYPYTPAQPKIQVKTSLIDIGVVVRDASGKPIGGLKKEDFQVFDNGKPREITNFAELTKEGGRGDDVSGDQSQENPVDIAARRKPAAARYAAFFFDDENMEAPNLIAARKAVLNYLSAPLEPGEKAGIFTTSGYVTTDFTSDVAALQASLGRVLPQPRRGAQSPLSCPNIGAYQAYQIVTEGGTLQLSQAFQLAYSQAVQCNCAVQDPQGICAQSEIRDVQTQAQRVLDRSTDVALETLRSLLGVIRYVAKFPGRRSIIVASDGFFTQNIQLERDRVIDSAAQAQIEINTVNAAGLFGPGVFNDGNASANLPHSVGPGNLPVRLDLVAYGTSLAQDEASFKQDVLSEFSEGTGGIFFHNNNDLGRGVKELAAAPDVAYSLAISGDNVKADGSFHNLRVKVGGVPAAKIAARRGFFAPSRNPPPDPAEIMRKMVLGSEELNAVPAALSVDQLKPAENVSGLRLNLKVDLKKLPYKNSTERKVQRILYVTALLDTKGNFLTGIAGEMSLKVKPATLKKIEPQGAEAHVSLQAPPGQYRLREIVREGVHGKFTATTRDVTIQ